MEYEKFAAENDSDGSLTNKAEGTITIEKQSTTGEETKKDIPLNIKGNVKIHYVEQGTNRELKTSENLFKQDVKVSTNYEAEPSDIPGYKLISNSGNTKGIVTEDIKNVTYYYERKSATPENPVLTKTGTYDAATKTITWKETVKNLNTYLTNEAYQVNIQKNISLRYINLPSNDKVTNKVTGHIKTDEGKTEEKTTASEEVITSIKGNLIVEYIYIAEDGTRKTLEIYEKIDEYVGTEYTTEDKHFDGYSIKSELIPANANGNITEGTTRVTYIYDRVPAEVEKNEINKKADNETVTSVKGAFDYTIKYDTTIKEYEGEAIITIVDKLDFAIDKEKSQLNGGIYNPEDLTITWTYNIDVNTYKNINKDISISIKIKLYYLNLEAKDRVITNNVNSSLQLETIKKPIEETDKTETKLEVPGKVIINFQDENGNTISESVTISGLVGDSYKVSSKEIEGYVLSKVEGNETETYIDGKITITYIYEKEGAGEVLPPQTKVDGITSSISSLLLFTISILLTFRKKILN